ncbi:MAG: hypothetical protein GWO02_02370 [Gammaproteobacteria bacterium]|nr:hypothetical protein [Gammaproteobacteria bacterium]
MCGRALVVVLWLVAGGAGAGAIPFDEYKLLREGMSEGEILRRVGPPDHERVVYQDHGIHRVIWYYIPDGRYSGDWSTEIHFDAHGRVIELERRKAF